MNGQLIAKEDLDQYTLVPAFVDHTEKWAKQLSYAVRLGNEFKGKTQITVESTDGPLVIETTIWGLTDNDLQLKGGKHIPLSSVIDVKYG